MKKVWLAALIFGLLCTGCDNLDEVKKLKAERDMLKAQIEKDKRLYNQMLK